MSGEFSQDALGRLQSFFGGPGGPLGGPGPWGTIWGFFENPTRPPPGGAQGDLSPNRFCTKSGPLGPEDPSEGLRLA